MLSIAANFERMPPSMPLVRRISSVFLRRFPQIQFRKEVTSFAMIEE